MSQRFNNQTERLRITAASDLAVDQIVQVQDVVGFVGDDIANGDTGLLWILQNAVIQPSQLNAAETWAAGQQLYWNAAAGVVTKHQTHMLLGIADKAKAASAQVEGGAAAGHRVIVGPRKEPNMVHYTIHFAEFPAAARAQGDFTLLAFGQPAHIDAATIYTQGDSSLAPATATIALGDGSGANDQIVAAAAISTYSGTVQNDVTPVNAQVDQVVLRIGGAAFTDGWLKIEVAYTLLG